MMLPDGFASHNRDAIEHRSMLIERDAHWEAAPYERSDMRNG